MFLCLIQGSNKEDNQRSIPDDDSDVDKTGKHGEHEGGGGDDQI